MKYWHKHMEFWVEELKGYGINYGPNGETLGNMDYYDLKAYMVKVHLQRDIEIKASPWF
ncbi:hypothetical protein ACRC6Q_16590 [Planococcus sp. SE5232]|uniref:hypothetical protein n=1 Tax=unclassified Planococcus (in: firmicutes) TaxID=2662419 RepID=UPI003D6A55B2